MKKVVLFLLAISTIVFSCSKTVKVPVSYKVQTTTGAEIGDVYVPDSGSYDWPVLVKFITGNTIDKVSLSFAGLPGDVQLAVDTVTGVPTFTGHFIFKTSHATQAKYPVTLTATAPGEKATVFNINLTVIPADCAAGYLGNFNATNVCSARNYPYTVTANATGSINSMDLVNFGGYGLSTTTHVIVDCAHDSLHIVSQNIGNGTIIQGDGTFGNNKMTIYYSATNTPGGFPETCTATLTR